MKKYHVVSFSGGKDSTAMLLRMVELGMQIDEIIFCDTGVEFPQMYEHIDKVEQYIGRKITKLKPEHDYRYMLLEYEINGRNGKKKGYSFAFDRMRWCTSYFKRDVVKRYIKGRNVVHYIGIAADEQKRIREKKYPLVEWGWTEADCLAYCYSKGLDWGGLYKIFNRVSCWCCPLQRIDALRKLRKHFSELWKQLISWQHSTWRSFKKDYTVDDLELRFALEDEWEKKGRDISSREFFKEFKLRKRGMRQIDLFEIGVVGGGSR